MTRRTGSPSVLSCRQAEAEIALQVGGDLDDPARTRLLQAHLANCPLCRDYERRLAECVEALQTCAVESLPTYRSGGLWPRVAAELPPCSPRPVLARFNVWVPTTAMACACAAMIFVTVIQIKGIVPADPTSSPQSWISVSSGPNRDYFSDPIFSLEGNRSPVPPLYAPGRSGQNLPTSLVWGNDLPLSERSQQPVRYSPRGEF